MTNTFFISDTHFGHGNICRFTRQDGTKLRPWDNIEEHDEELVKRWNSVVRPQDKVYHLGDVVINRKHLPILGRLNGRKTLVKGNHDILKLEEYSKYFENIHGVRPLNGIILSHIPLHPNTVGRFGVNIHGHLHDRRVMTKTYKEVIDPMYVSVCVEQINYTPISLDELRKYAPIVNKGGLQKVGAD